MQRAVCLANAFVAAASNPTAPLALLSPIAISKLCAISNVVDLRSEVQAALLQVLKTSSPLQLTRFVSLLFFLPPLVLFLIFSLLLLPLLLLPLNIIPLFLS